MRRPDPQTAPRPAPSLDDLLERAAAGTKDKLVSAWLRALRGGEAVGGEDVRRERPAEARA